VLKPLDSLGLFLATDGVYRGTKKWLSLVNKRIVQAGISDASLVKRPIKELQGTKTLTMVVDGGVIVERLKKAAARMGEKSLLLFLCIPLRTAQQ